VLRQVRLIRRRRQLESWGRGLRWFSDLIMTLFLSALYLTLGALGIGSYSRAQAAARSVPIGGEVRR
jgi:hypothetical protein